MKLSQLINLVMLVVLCHTITACNPEKRYVVAGSATSFGINISATDVTKRPPRVSIAFDRAEFALVPTQGEAAVNGGKNNDAFSTLMAFHLDTSLWGNTEIRQFIGTGHAAVKLADSDELAEALGVQLSIGNWSIFRMLIDTISADPTLLPPGAIGHLEILNSLASGLGESARMMDFLVRGDEEEFSLVRHSDLATGGNSGWSFANLCVLMIAVEDTIADSESFLRTSDGSPEYRDTVRVNLAKCVEFRNLVHSRFRSSNSIRQLIELLIL